MRVPARLAGIGELQDFLRARLQHFPQDTRSAGMSFYQRKWSRGKRR